MTERFLTRKEAAEYIQSHGLPIAATTLAKLVTVGGGPKFRRFGRNAVYTSTDLDSWASDRLGDAVANSSLRKSIKQ